MDRIKGAGHVNNRWVAEDAATSRPPTEFTPEWFNGVQEELVGLVESQGLAPSDADWTQVRKAISLMIEARVGDYAIDTGAANAYVVAMNPPVQAYKAGLEVKFRATHLNTGASTLNAGAGAVALVRNDGAPMQLGDVPVGSLVSAVCDGINGPFIVESIVPSQTLTQAAADLRYLQVGTVNLPAGLPLNWPTLDCPAWAVVRDGSAMTRTVYPGLYAVLAPLRSCTITMNAAGAVVTGLSRTADLWVGMPVEHASLPAGTTVKTIDGTGQVTLSVNSTATATTTLRLFLHGYGNGGGALTFGLPDDRGLFERGLDNGARGYEKSTIAGTTVLNSNVISGVASTRGLFIGQAISAPSGISAGATITGLSATTITMSLVSPLGGAVAITVVGGQIGNEFIDTLQGHFHQSTTNSNKGYTPGSTVNDYVNPAIAVATTTASAIGPAITDGVNGTPRISPETRPHGRNYLPIMVI